MEAEIKVVQCNYAVATNVAAKGARAYVSMGNCGNHHDRIRVLVRSRGGRWVDKYEDIRYLENFRQKTLVADDPVYAKLTEFGYTPPAGAEIFVDARERWLVERPLTGVDP